MLMKKLEFLKTGNPKKKKNSKQGFDKIYVKVLFLSAMLSHKKTFKKDFLIRSQRKMVCNLH